MPTTNGARLAGIVALAAAITAGTGWTAGANPAVQGRQRTAPVVVDGAAAFDGFVSLAGRTTTAGAGRTVLGYYVGRTAR